MKTFSMFFLTIIAAVIAGCDKLTEQDAEPPTITAQGFMINTAQEGEVGQFKSLKVRIESPAGIEKLQITERSYDVDLAITPDRDHFKLFDLDRRVTLARDVTLDFQNYINSKLIQPGEYSIAIDVADKKRQPAKTTIVVRLVEPVVAPASESSSQQPDAENAAV